MCFAPQRRALFRHLNFQKWSFVHFDFKMCFAPQRRALFRHRNFQKWSDHGVFCTFWLGNVLRATTARAFSTSQLPKVVRTWGVLYLLTWKCASRHNGVQFFIAPVASWLRTRRFSEPTFRPSWATNHWKNTVFRDFPTFSRICIFCPLTLSLLLFSLLIFLFSLPLPYSAFHLSILSEVWLLNFLRWTIWESGWIIWESVWIRLALCHTLPQIRSALAKVPKGTWAKAPQVLAGKMQPTNQTGQPPRNAASAQRVPACWRKRKVSERTHLSHRSACGTSGEVKCGRNMKESY